MFCIVSDDSGRSVNRDVRLGMCNKRESVDVSVRGGMMIRWRERDKWFKSKCVRRQRTIKKSYMSAKRML